MNLSRQHSHPKHQSAVHFESIDSVASNTKHQHQQQHEKQLTKSYSSSTRHSISDFPNKPRHPVAHFHSSPSFTHTSSFNHSLVSSTFQILKQPIDFTLEPSSTTHTSLYFNPHRLLIHNGIKTQLFTFHRALYGAFKCVLISRLNKNKHSHTMKQNLHKLIQFLVPILQFIQNQIEFESNFYFISSFPTLSRNQRSKSIATTSEILKSDQKYQHVLFNISLNLTEFHAFLKQMPLLPETISTFQLIQLGITFIRHVFQYLHTLQSIYASKLQQQLEWDYTFNSVSNQNLITSKYITQLRTFYASLSYNTMAHFYPLTFMNAIVLCTTWQSEQENALYRSFVQKSMVETLLYRKYKRWLRMHRELVTALVEQSNRPMFEIDVEQLMENLETDMNGSDERKSLKWSPSISFRRSISFGRSGSLGRSGSGRKSDVAVVMVKSRELSRGSSVGNSAVGAGMNNVAFNPELEYGIDFVNGKKMTGVERTAVKSKKELLSLKKIQSVQIERDISNQKENHKDLDVASHVVENGVHLDVAKNESTPRNANLDSKSDDSLSLYTDESDSSEYTEESSYNSDSDTDDPLMSMHSISSISNYSQFY